MHCTEIQAMTPYSVEEEMTVCLVDLEVISLIYPKTLQYIMESTLEPRKESLNNVTVDPVMI